MVCHIKPEQFFNLIFGYYDRYFEALSDLNPGAGTNIKEFSTVPSGEVWIVNNINARNDARAVSIMFDAYNGTNSARIKRETSGGAGVDVIWNGTLVLKAGDRARVWFFTTTAGDDLRWEIWGYKMKISQ